MVQISWSAARIKILLNPCRYLEFRLYYILNRGPKAFIYWQLYNGSSIKNLLFYWLSFRVRYWIIRIINIKIFDQRTQDLKYLQAFKLSERLPPPLHRLTLENINLQSKETNNGGWNFRAWISEIIP